MSKCRDINILSLMTEGMFFDSLPLYCAVEGNRNEEKANGFPSLPRYLMYFVDCILF